VQINFATCVTNVGGKSFCPHIFHTFTHYLTIAKAEKSICIYFSPILRAVPTPYFCWTKKSIAKYIVLSKANFAPINHKKAKVNQTQRIRNYSNFFCAAESCVFDKPTANNAHAHCYAVEE
jgi:hypothetical protein